MKVIDLTDDPIVVDDLISNKQIIKATFNSRLAKKDSKLFWNSYKSKLLISHIYD